MSIETIVNLIPDYAKDLKQNLNSVLLQPELTETQIWGVAYASALATKNQKLIEHIAALAEQKLSKEALDAAKLAAALMAMNNIFYKFPTLVGKEQYFKIPANLKMTGLRSHGHNQHDFELYALAVSVINSCVYCIQVHEKKLIQGGISEEQIIASVRIAAVIHGVASVLL